MYSANIDAAPMSKDRLDMSEVSRRPSFNDLPVTPPRATRENIGTHYTDLINSSAVSNGMTSETEDHNAHAHRKGRASPANSLETASSTESGRRRRPWRKGGFLLGGSAIQNDEPDKMSDATSRHTSKGKRKSDDYSLVVQKHRRSHDHSIRNSYNGSPLSQEITQDTREHNHLMSGHVSDRTRSAYSGSSHAESSTSHPASPTNVQTSVPPTVGYDTDPAQIVNMALALSEGRRRYFSNQRASPNAHGKPLLSPRALQERRQGSLGQYLQSQRQASRNISPRSRHVAALEKRPPTSFRQSSLHGLSGPEGTMDSEAGEAMYDISDATYARVEKAKVYFELMYEYRRLLQHLPPLAPCKAYVPNSVSQGRSYNPLQYVRNRKTRFREKQPIPSEEDGWHDVERVRAWVDSIVEAQGDERMDPYTCVRLPQLPQGLNSIGSDANGMAEMSSQRHDKEATNTKPRRPRLDWVFHPGDVLADAFWLEQGLNKSKIEDREGNRLYTENSPLRFVGWSRSGQVESDDLPQSEKEPVIDPTDIIRHPTLPDLPNFQRTSKEGTGSRRGQTSKLLKHPIRELHDSGGRSRKKRSSRLGALTRSFSSSSSDTASDSPASGSRGRKRGHNDQNGKNPDKALNLEDTIMKSHNTSAQNGKRMVSEQQPGDEDPEFSRAERLAITGKIRTGEQERLPRENGGAQSRPETDEENHPRTSYEGDTTAPNSPIHSGFPSIAVSLSPPASRDTSPVRKPLPNPINLLRHGRTKSHDRVGISTTDFASSGRSPLHSRSPSVEPPQRTSTVPTPMESREQSPFSKRANTMPDEVSPAQLRRLQANGTKNGIKPSVTDQPSKFKGIFKGGRIAEIVGNEVSRVGDFIWKRDTPGLVHVSSAGSSITSDAEVSEDEATSKAFPRDLRQESTSSRDGAQNRVTRGAQPQYHISNLPVFTSPFKKDQEEREQQERGASEEPDSQNKGQDLAPPTVDLDRRGSTVSDRFQRLAPPKLDLSRVSSLDQPQDSPPNSRRSSYLGGGLVSNFSQNSAGARPRTGRYTAVPVTGLIDVPPINSHSSGHHKDASNVSGSQSPSASHTPAPITARDIDRTRVVLLSSALKAREISRRANTARDRPPSFLLDSLSSPSKSLPYIPRKEEHIYASRHLLAAISSDTIRLRTLLSKTFSTSSSSAGSSASPISTLHTSLAHLESLIDSTLIPRVRSAADQAGTLSQSLTTTSALAVKQLNDSIDAATRRRRKGAFGGVQRGVRKLLWGSIEAAVVGLLWLVWGVVTSIRILRAIIRFVVGVLGWLFFLQ